GVWLRRLQEQQIEQRSYEYSSLAQIQSWWGQGVGTSPDGILGEHSVGQAHRLLFESLLVFENFPVQTVVAEQQPVDLSCVNVAGQEPCTVPAHALVETVYMVEQTNYPLTIAVEPGAGQAQGMILRVSYDRQRFEQAAIERLLEHLYNCLQQLVAD